MGRLKTAGGRVKPANTRIVGMPQYEARRGSARARGYDWKWSKASKRFLRDNPLCRGCLAVGRVEPAVVTDHVIPFMGDERLKWRRDLWQASCKWHHDVVKQALERRWTNAEIADDDLWLDSAVAVTTTKRLMAE